MLFLTWIGVLIVMTLPITFAANDRPVSWSIVSLAIGLTVIGVSAEV